MATPRRLFEKRLLVRKSQSIGTIAQNRDLECFIGAVPKPRIPVRGQESIVWGE
jgi:hypothetical protein